MENTDTVKVMTVIQSRVLRLMDLSNTCLEAMKGVLQTPLAPTHVYIYMLELAAGIAADAGLPEATIISKVREAVTKENS